MSTFIEGFKVFPVLAQPRFRMQKTFFIQPTRHGQLRMGAGHRGYLQSHMLQPCHKFPTLPTPNTASVLSGKNRTTILYIVFRIRPNNEFVWIATCTAFDKLCLYAPMYRLHIATNTD